MAFPLLEAAKRGDVTIVQLLLERRADVTSADEDGLTALDYAVKDSDNFAIVKLLCASKADLISRSRAWTPLHEAVRSEHWDMAGFPAAAVQLLLDHSASMNIA